jgi:glucan phosphoethanolaminetransferase (alkaline phosphatase superfamily)
MVELDELKQIWQQKSSGPTSKIDAESLRELLKGKSFTIFEKLRRNLLIEIILYVISLALVLGVAWYFQSRVITTLILACIVCVFIPYLVYYISKYNQLRKLTFFSSDIKSSLEGSIETLQKYLNLYMVGSIVLTPVTVFLVATIFMYELKELGLLQHFNPTGQGFIWMALTAAVLATAINIPLMRWYVRKMYGKYVAQLKQYLGELNDSQ